MSNVTKPIIQAISGDVTRSILGNLSSDPLDPYPLISRVSAANSEVVPATTYDGQRVLIWVVVSTTDEQTYLVVDDDAPTVNNFVGGIYKDQGGLSSDGGITVNNVYVNKIPVTWSDMDGGYAKISTGQKQIVVFDVTLAAAIDRAYLVAPTGLGSDYDFSGTIHDAGAVLEANVLDVDAFQDAIFNSNGVALPSSILYNYRSFITRVWGAMDIGQTSNIFNLERDGASPAQQAFSLSDLDTAVTWAGSDNARVRKFYDAVSSGNVQQATFANQARFINSGVQVADPNLSGYCVDTTGTVQYGISNNYKLATGKATLWVTTAVDGAVAHHGNDNNNNERVLLRTNHIYLRDSGANDTFRNHSEGAGTHIWAVRYEGSNAFRGQVNGTAYGGFSSTLTGALNPGSWFNRNGAYISSHVHLQIDLSGVTEQNILDLMSDINDLHSIY